jgi:quinol monooxygenase YgiN
MTRTHLTLRAKPGRRDELLATLDRLELAVATGDRDLLEVEVHVPVDDPDGVLVVSTWPSPEHYERWRSGPGWERILQALDGLVAQPPETSVYRLVDAIG